MIGSPGQEMEEIPSDQVAPRDQLDIDYIKAHTSLMTAQASFYGMCSKFIAVATPPIGLLLDELLVEAKRHH